MARALRTAAAAEEHVEMQSSSAPGTQYTEGEGKQPQQPNQTLPHPAPSLPNLAADLKPT